jgi:hypothetical protein
VEGGHASGGDEHDGDIPEVDLAETRMATAALLTERGNGPSGHSGEASEDVSGEQESEGKRIRAAGNGGGRPGMRAEHTYKHRRGRACDTRAR